MRVDGSLFKFENRNNIKNIKYVINYFDNSYLIYCLIKIKIRINNFILI